MTTSYTDASIPKRAALFVVVIVALAAWLTANTYGPPRAFGRNLFRSVLIVAIAVPALVAAWSGLRSRVLSWRSRNPASNLEHPSRRAAAGLRRLDFYVVLAVIAAALFAFAHSRRYRLTHYQAAGDLSAYRFMDWQRPTVGDRWGRQAAVPILGTALWRQMSALVKARPRD